MDGDDSPVVAITGAAGMVGRALARRLASELPEHRLLLLTRRPVQLHLPRATWAFSDICQPNLGMDQQTQTLLRERTELFVHCAADIRFNLPLDQARQVNTEGSRNAMQFARECRNLRHFAHISTLYVAGRREGLVREQPLRHASGYVNSYEASKHEAEELFLSDSADLPAGVYRLSSVIDLESNQGHIRQALRFAAWAGHFPFFPGKSNIPLDFISSAWAAHCLSTLIVHHAESGCVRHICAGQANALRMGAVFDRIFAAYASHTRNPPPRPNLVPLEEFERLRAQLRPGSLVSRALESLMTFLPHVAIHQPFENATTSALLAQQGVPNADMESLLGNLLGQELGTPAIASQRDPALEQPC